MNDHEPKETFEFDGPDKLTIAIAVVGGALMVCGAIYVWQLAASALKALG